MALNVAKAGFPLSLYDAEEGRTQELRESWVKDKHLPTGMEVMNITSYDAVKFLSRNLEVYTAVLIPTPMVYHEGQAPTDKVMHVSWGRTIMRHLTFGNR